MSSRHDDAERDSRSSRRVWTLLALSALAIGGVFGLSQIGFATSPGPSPGGPCGDLIADLGADPEERGSTAAKFGLPSTVAISAGVEITSIYCWDRSGAESEGVVDAIMAVGEGGNVAWLILSDHANRKFESGPWLEWETVAADYGFVDMLPTDYGFRSAIGDEQGELWSSISSVALGGS